MRRILFDEQNRAPAPMAMELLLLTILNAWDDDSAPSIAAFGATMSLWGTGGITLIIKWCRDSLLLLQWALARHLGHPGPWCWCRMSECGQVQCWTDDSIRLFVDMTDRLIRLWVQQIVCPSQSRDDYTWLGQDFKSWSTISLLEDIIEEQYRLKWGSWSTIRLYAEWRSKVKSIW